MNIGDFPDGPVVKTSPSDAGDVGSIPGWGPKISHASWPKNQNIKQKQYCNTFNKDFKNGPHQKSLKILKQKNKQKNPKMHIGVNYGSLWLVRFVLCSHILKC